MVQAVLDPPVVQDSEGSDDSSMVVMPLGVLGWRLEPPTNIAEMLHLASGEVTYGKEGHPFILESPSFFSVFYNLRGLLPQDVLTAEDVDIDPVPVPSWFRQAPEIRRGPIMRDETLKVVHSARRSYLRSETVGSEERAAYLPFRAEPRFPFRTFPGLDIGSFLDTLTSNPQRIHDDLWDFRDLSRRLSEPRSLRYSEHAQRFRLWAEYVTRWRNDSDAA